MNKRSIITLLLALVALNAMAQASFDSEGGCLNVMKRTSLMRMIPVGVITTAS